jgi:NIMA (never in mitosis gene a)-related kinase
MYVIKKLKTFEIRQKEKENIENEVRLLSRLNHPNIVNYKESFTDSEQNMYIVMKYCEEGDLYKRIRDNKGKQFTESQVEEWMAQLFLALNFLHERKILHRDIKTQNIFISKGKLFLGDFGISKSLDNTRELANTVG